MSENLQEVREIILEMYHLASMVPELAQDYEEDCELERESHARFLSRQFDQLSRGMVGQDSGQPWFLFWLLNGIEVCNQSGVKITDDIKSRCVKYLKRCHNDKDGGFCGAPGLQSHLASTYAAVMAIVNIGTPEAYQIVDVEKMRAFLHSIKNNLDLELEPVHPNNSWIFKDKISGDLFQHGGAHQVIGTLPGAVAIHINGEMDMRGVYCALVVAEILNIMDEKLTRGMGSMIASCQTYEGGIACAPYGEAHGGYTYCGLAALILLKESYRLNLDRCLEWLTQRQLTIEGGFNGRINKLVDSCYNFWQGAAFELIDIASNGKMNLQGEWLFNQQAVQAYTLFCCQTLGGGVKDKPTKGPDPYHTSYGLSGCSFAQHKSDFNNLHSETEHSKEFQRNFDGNYGSNNEEQKESDTTELNFEKTCLLSGILENKLRRFHPIFNARYDYVCKAKEYFRQIK